MWQRKTDVKTEVVKTDRKRAEVESETWERSASDRDRWKRLVETAKQIRWRVLVT